MKIDYDDLTRAKLAKAALHTRGIGVELTPNFMKDETLTSFGSESRTSRRSSPALTTSWDVGDGCKVKILSRGPDRSTFKLPQDVVMSVVENQPIH